MTRRLKAVTGLALLLIVLTSATTLTFAAVGTGTPATPAAKPKTPVPLVVPDVRGQAYVFAKGILEDAGFAWRVGGAVEGYAVNLVSRQEPAPGTIVVDTGAPMIALTLSRNTSYRQVGTPENSAPYAGTAVILPGRAAKPVAKPKAQKTKPLAKKRQAVAKAKKPAVTTKPAKPSAKVAYRGGKLANVAYRGGKVAARPPAFVAPGAPPEPLNEMPLPDRARMLAAWLERHPEKTDAAVKHWLYQNAWVVYGTKFGWWHGAQALEILIGVDQRAQQLWGIGTESEAQARAALDFVAQRSS